MLSLSKHETMVFSFSKIWIPAFAGMTNKIYFSGSSPICSICCWSALMRSFGSLSEEAGFLGLAAPPAPLGPPGPGDCAANAWRRDPPACQETETTQTRRAVWNPSSVDIG